MIASALNVNAANVNVVKKEVGLLANLKFYNMK